VGKELSFNAVTTGGEAPLKWSFYVYGGGRVYHSELWKGENSFTWTPTSAGTYTVAAYCKDSTGYMVKYVSTVIIGDASAPEPDETVLFDFESGKQGWEDHWGGTPLTIATAETSALKYNFAFNSSNNGNWDSQPQHYSNSQFTVGDSDYIAYDLYLQADTGASGKFQQWVAFGYSSIPNPSWFLLNPVELDVTKGQRVGNLLKFTVKSGFTNHDNPQLSINPNETTNWIRIQTVGLNTGYSGAIYVDNIRLGKNR
jgi:hypothetical protein